MAADGQMPLTQQTIMQTAVSEATHLISPIVLLILLLPCWWHADFQHDIWKELSTGLCSILQPRVCKRPTHWYYFWVPAGSAAHSLLRNMDGVSLNLKPKPLLDLSPVSPLLFFSLNDAQTLNVVSWFNLSRRLGSPHPPSGMGERIRKKKSRDKLR